MNQIRSYTDTLLLNFVEQYRFFFYHQLLHNKANVNAVNEHGNTPLHYACFWNCDTVAEVLYLNALVFVCIQAVHSIVSRM